MCGIFGAIGNHIENEILQKISAEAKKRGPHAYGISWLSNDSICTQKKSCEINPKKAFSGIETTAIIGNCRLSTSGTYKNIANNQPIVLGNMAISHNGNVKSYLQIAKDIGVELETQCDSEIICHLIRRFGVKDALKKLEKEMPMALLILQDNKITAFRNGQPLYVNNIGDCFYFCSRKFQNAEPLEEGKPIVFDSEGGIGEWK